MTEEALNVAPPEEAPVPVEPVAAVEPETPAAPEPEAPAVEEVTVTPLDGVEAKLADLIDYLGTLPAGVPHIGQAIDHLRDARVNLFPGS